MQVRDALLVFRKRIFFSVKRKLAVGDTVAVTSDERALIAAAVEITLDTVEPANYVGELTVSVGQPQLGDNTAERQNFYLCARLDRKSVV